jgi:hypothetical protein
MEVTDSAYPPFGTYEAQNATAINRRDEIRTVELRLPAKRKAQPRARRLKQAIAIQHNKLPLEDVGFRVKTYQQTN